MTTYSNVIKHDLASVKFDRHILYAVNIVLLALVAVLTFGYVFLANFYVAQKYSLNLGKNELNSINARSVSEDSISVNPDASALLLFAHKYGMIEAKEIDSIIQDSNFAITESQ